MRKRSPSLAAVLAFCALLHGVATAETASCPLSTSVFPVTFIDLSQYEVHVTDGGPGDLDAVADGACDLALTACLGTAACAPAPVHRVRVIARGRPIDATPREIAGEILAAFENIPGAERAMNGVSVNIPEATSPEMCGQARVRLAASWRSDQNLTLRLNVRHDGGNTASRLRLRCVPNEGAAAAPLCFGREGTPCPLEPGQPGFPETTSTTTTTLPEDPSADDPTTTTTTTPGTEESPTTTTSTIPPVAPAPGGRTYYISPTGGGDGSGTTRSAAFSSFSRAVSRLEPGDVLVVLDGTYTRETTGLPRIDCESNAQNGTAERPITIRAENERAAFLSSDGYQAGFEMSNCRWWRVEGLRAASQDASGADQGGGFPFRVHQVEDVTLRRLLGSHNNRPQNTHIYAIENSRNVLLEECEAYFFHRHAFSVWKSYGVTLRRCYANSMRYGTDGCCSDIDNRDFGDSAVSLYGSSGSILENCISENQANGFHVAGIENSLDPSGQGGRHNQILGSISLDDAIAGLVSSRASDGTYHNALGNVFRDFVAIGTEGNGLYVRGAAEAVVENATLYGSRAIGFVADGGDSSLGGTCGSGNPEGCSFTARNVLAVNNAALGIATEEQDEWEIEYSNAIGSEADWGVGEDFADTAGRVQRSLSTPAGAIGLGAGQCVAWIPEGSPMKRVGDAGRDIGANIVYRYEDGVLSGTPLWDPVTGAFPCGAIVTGINDGARSCRNLHERLNVNTNGCRLPLPTAP
jgi:hypothetical protein